MDKIPAIILSAMMITLFASIISWKFIIFSSLFALLYGFMEKGAKKNEDHLILANARELRYLCQDHGLTYGISSLSKNSSVPKELKKLLKMLSLGYDGPFTAIQGQESSNELAELVAASLRSGADIKESLNAFISDLESKIDAKNSATQNALNMDTLSMLGIYFFVPVFGGIGASIMSGSAAILGFTHAPTNQFEYIIVIYTGLMTFIMSIFNSNGTPKSLFNSLRSAIVSGGIIKATAALMVYAI